MRNPLPDAQPKSWREVVATLYRALLNRSNGAGHRLKTPHKWLLGGLLAALVAASISLVALAREHSPKTDSLTASASEAAAKAEAVPVPAKLAAKNPPAASPAPKKSAGKRATPSKNSQPEPAAAAPQPQASQNSASSSSQPKQQEDADLIQRRAQWFHEQRAYPFKHIPSGALQKAIEQRDLMRQRQRAASGRVSAAGIINFPGDALWHLMGPQPTNQPFGNVPGGGNSGFPTTSGRVNAIAVDSTDATGQTVYIGGAAGGVWKTTNGGTSWAPLTDAQPSLAVGSIAIDPNNHLNIYVGTGEENFNIDAFYGVGILKSADGGQTWIQQGASIFAGSQTPQVGGAKIGTIAVQPGGTGVVLAAVTFLDGGTRGGIYRSPDGGTTWAQVSAGTPPIGAAATAVVFDPGTPTNAYAAMGDSFGDPTHNGIYKSTDSGVTWSKLAGGLPATNIGRITLGFAASTTGPSATIYAAIADSSTNSSNLLNLFRTVDSGTTWTVVTGPAGGFCNGQCFYDMAIGVDPRNAQNVVLGGGAYTDNFTSLFESTNGGTSWTGTSTDDFSGPASGIHPHVDTHAIVFTPSAATLRLYIGNDGGMWRTDNPFPGGVSPTWVDLNAPLALTQFYPGPSAAISDENSGFGGTQDNDTEAFSGTLAWSAVGACGDGGFTAIDHEFPTTIYTSCAPGSGPGLVAKSVFNGTLVGGSPSFVAADTGIAHESSLFIPPLAIDDSKSAPNLYYGTCRVWQTTDGAALWTAITGNLPSGTNTLGAPCNGVGNITSFDIAHSNRSVVVAGTSNGKIWETLSASLGAASTWTEIDNLVAGQLPARHVTAVRTLRSDSTGQTVYATFSGFGSCAGCDGKGHVFLTSNGGTAWTDISGNLPDIPVNDIIVSHNDNPTFDALYIATDVGVFSCPSPALTLCPDWTVVGDGLPNSPVLALAMRDSSRILRAASHGRSMWQIQLTDENPGPVAFLSSLTPAAAFVGDPTTAVTVTGGNFSTNTRVLFDGVSVGTPTFVSTTQLTISVNSSLLTDGHVFQVSLTDPQGAENGSGPFAVMNPILGTPTLTNPSTTAGIPYTLHFTGSNFVNSTAVTLTTFGNLTLSGGTASSNGTVFDVPVPAAFLTAAMPVSGTITNPLPGGGPTPAFSFNFTINPGTIIFNPNPIALSTFLGTTSPVMNVAVINTSASSATITAQSIGGAIPANFSFALPTFGTTCNFPPTGQSGTGTITLAANGGTCNFGITYTAGTPPGNAVSNATLSVTDNASGSPQTAPIQGTPLPSTVVLLPVNFGPVTVGTTSPTMNATLSNFSGSSINVTSAFTVSGTNQADFHIVSFVSSGVNPACPTAPFPLANGASCDVTLTFTPSLPAGNETAQLNVTASVAVTTFTPNLTGTGIEITSISPTIVATGGPAFTLTVNGGGFTPSTVVNVNSSARLTTFVSANQLLASIPASDIAVAGSLAISVTVGGVQSEPKTLIVAQAFSATNDNVNFATVAKAGGTDIRTASAPYAGGSTAVTLNWSPAFPDTNYTAVCTVETNPSDFLLPLITLRNPGSMQVVPTSGGSPSGTIYCIAIPDSDTTDIRHGRTVFSASPASVTVNWNSAFPDTNYTSVCTAETQGSTAGGFTSVISALTTASVTVINSGQLATGTMHCIAVPDSDGSVVRHGRAVLSGSPATVAVQWDTPFPDVNYASVCFDVQLGAATASSAIAVLAGSRTTSQLNTINEIASGIVHCLAVPTAASIPFRISQDTTQATTQLTANSTTPVDPTPAPCVPGTATLAGRARSVWFTFTPTSNGTVVADTRFSSYTTILSAWTLSGPLPSGSVTFTAVPNTCASENVPASGASPLESFVKFNVTANTHYYIMVSDASAGAAGGNLTFSLDFASAAPANDDNATPTVIAPASLPYSNTVNSIMATANTNTHNDPVLPGGCATGAASSGQANSVWYTFTPTSSGTITADTLTSPYATILNVTSGSPTGTQVACNQSAAAGIAQSQVSFAATSGTQYLFMISSFLGDGGTTNFHLASSAAVGGNNNFTNGGGDSQWTTATNWSLGHVPTSTETVTDTGGLNITLSSGAQAVGTISFSNGGTLTISGGSLTFTGASTATNINITGGTLTANAALTVTGSLGMGAGTLNGSGNVTTGGLAFGGGIMTGTGTTLATAGMSANGGTLDGRTLNNAGTWSASGASMTLQNGAVFNNLATGTITLNSGTFSLGAGAASFNNAGTLAFSPANSTIMLTFAMPFTNSGTLGYGVGGFGNYVFNGGYTQTAGTTNLPNPNVALLTTPTATFNGGTLVGRGTISGNVVNNGGTIHPGVPPLPANIMTIGGTYTQGSGGTLLFDLGGTGSTQYAQLAITGAATLGGTLTTSPVGSFTPAPNDAFQVMTFASRTGDFTTNNLTVNGVTLVKNFHTGDLTLTAPAAGVNTFTDNIGDHLWTTPGNWSLGHVPTATEDVAIGSTFSPLLNSGAQSIRSLTMTSTGTLSISGSGASLAIAMPSSATNIAVNIGTLMPTGSLTITGSLLVNGTGVLRGTGNVTVNSGGLGLNWNGGTIGGDNSTTVVAAGAILTIGGGGTHTFTAQTLNNQGTATWQATGTNIVSGNGAVFNNSGTFNVTNNATFDNSLGGAAPQFNNTGTFSKPSGGGTTNFNGVPFTNSGTVNANNGTLNFAAGFTQTAGTTTLNGGNIQAGAPGFVLNGGTLNGTATITGNVINNGGIVKPGLSPGTLTITGNYTQGPGGTLNIELAGTAAGQFGLLAISGTATLGPPPATGGTINALSSGGFTPAAGNSFQVMTYASESGDFGTKNLTVNGVTLTEALNATNLTLNAPGVANLTLAPNPVVFGNQKVGTTSSASSATLTNIGSANATISTVSALGGSNPGDFALQAPAGACANGTVLTTSGPSSSCTITATFKPTATGARSATVTITDNAPASPRTLTFNGTGTAPAANLSTNTIAFGNVPLSTTSAPMSVTLTNTGNATLVLGNPVLTVGGTNPGDFTIAAGTTCTNNLVLSAAPGPGNTCTVNVTFTPSAANARSATLTFTDDASPTTQVVNLTGTGTAASVALSPAPVNFANQRINTTSAATTVTLTNSGNQSVTLAASNAVTFSGTNSGDFATAGGTTCTNGAVIAASPGPGNTCVIMVTFTPGANGARSATLNVADNAVPSPQSVTLNGTGTVPTASVAPPNIPFGNQRKGTTSAGTDVTVSNTGTDSLNIASIALTGANPTQFTLGAPSSGTACSLVAATPVAAGSNCKFSVKFAPTATGAQAANATITDDTGGTAGSIQNVGLTGTGISPTASVAPLNIPFGNLRTGTTSAGTDVTVSNTGTDTLNIATIVLTGADTSQFALGAPSSGTACSLVAATPVAAGANCKFSVKFAPTTTGAKNANVAITDDSGAAAGSVQNVTLSGTGVFPQASAAPANLPFGNVPVTTTSAPMPITLTNNGTDTLHLAASGAVAITGTNASDFSVVAGTTTCINSGSVNAGGGSCVINVTFTPGATGARGPATLTITDDANPTTQTVTLSGTGVTAAVNLTPSPVNFNNQRTGTTSAATTITLTNSGNAAVHLGGGMPVTITGTNPADFAIVAGTTTCTANATIAAAPGPGNTCIINVTFTPGVNGARSAVLNVADDAPGNPQTDNLMGTGVFPQASPAPNPVPFGSQVINTTSGPMTVTVTNGGTDTLHLAASNAVVIGGANAGDFAIASGTTCTNSAPVAPSANCIINVTFTPSALNARTATITITDDASPTTQVVTLNGTGTNPAPTITSLAPNSATAGGASFLLTITGTGFVSGATVNFGANPALTPTTITSTTITVTVPAADIATAANINVTVTNPAPGGGTSAPPTPFTINNPVPTLASIAPTSGLLNQSVNLVLTGTNFVTGSVVNFGANADNGGVVSNNGTTLTITIPAAQLNVAGPVNVTVTNPAPGGGTSTPALTFTVNNPAPTLTSIAPTSGTLNQSVNLTLTGTNFIAASIVNFGANADNGGVVSNNGNTLTITIPAAQLNVAGPVNVTVKNPTPGGGTTAPQVFTVNNPVPTLTSIAPTSGVEGNSVNLVLTGTNFVAGAIVNFGANADGGGVVSNNGTTLTITIPAAQLTTAGPVNVTVTNPAPGGGTTAAQQFTVQNVQPVVSSLVPANTTAGGPAFQLTVNSSTNTFVSGAVVSFNGAAKTTTFVSSSQLTASILVADIATAGNFNVIVTNPAPAVGPSAAFNFPVNNPVPTITAALAAGVNHAAGGTAFTLTVNGTKFSSGTNETSAVNFNGKAEPTTFVDSMHVTANIPATDVATAVAGTTVNVTVTNPAPGGGTTATSAAFAVDGYTLTGPANPVAVKAGQTASIPITIKPSANGFANQVSFGVTGLPLHAALVAVSPVTPGNAPQVVNVMITTKAGSSAPLAPTDPPLPPLLRFLLVTWIAALLAGAYAARLIRRTPRLRPYAAVVPLALLLISGAVLAGCSGMGVPGTPKGNFQLTITATSGTVAEPAQATLTVQ